MRHNLALSYLLIVRVIVVGLCSLHKQWLSSVCSIDLHCFCFVQAREAEEMRQELGLGAKREKGESSESQLVALIQSKRKNMFGG